MQIQRQLISDPGRLVRGQDQALSGVRTEQGKVAPLSDAGQLPAQLGKGDVFIKLGDNQVLQLSLSEPASRAQLLGELYKEIGSLDPKSAPALKKALIEVYLKLARSSGNVPGSSELGQRVAELETRLSEQNQGQVQDESESKLRTQLARKFPELGSRIEIYLAAYKQLNSGNLKDAFEGFGRMTVLIANEPKLLEFFKPEFEKLAAKFDGNPKAKAFASIIRKTYLDADPAKSVSRIKQLAVLTEIGNKPFEAKHVRALFETLHEYGTDIKALMPQSVQVKIDQLELYLGSKLPEMVKKLLPMAGMADFSKAFLKFISSDNLVSKTAGVMDFMAAVGKTYAKDAKHFNAICEFLKFNTLLEDHWKTLFEAGGQPSTAAQKLAALHELGKAYSMKTIELGLRTQSLAFTAEQLSEMGAKNADEALALMKALGMSDGETYAKVMKQLSESGASGSEAILKAFSSEVAGQLKNLGATSAKEASELLTRLGGKPDEALKLLEELGLKGKPAKDVLALFNKLGAKSAAEAKDIMTKLGAKTLSEAAELSTKLGVTAGSNGAELLRRLGVDSAEKASQMMQRLGVKTPAEAIALLDKLGVESGEAALEAIAKLGPTMTKPALLKAMSDLGLKHAAEAVELVKDMKATNLQQCADLMRRMAARSGAEALEIFREMGSKNAFEAISQLSNMKYADPVQLARTVGAKDFREAIRLMKEMKLTNLPSVQKVMRELAAYGVKNGHDAVKLMQALGIDDVRNVAAAMKSLGVRTLSEAQSLIRNLGAKNAPEAVQTLSKIGLSGRKPGELPGLISRTGLGFPLDAAKIDKLKDFMGKMGGTSLEKALNDLKRIGFKDLDDAIARMPQLGFDNADKVLEAFKKFGIASVDDALAHAAKLGPGTSFKRAGEIMSAFGPFSTNIVGNTASKLGLKGMSADNVLDALKAFGLDPADPANIKKAMDQMGSIKASSAREAWELMQKMGVVNMDEAVGSFAKLGVGNAKEGLEVLGKLGSKTLADALEAMKKLNAGTVKEASKMLAELGVKSADEALKLLSAFGADDAKSALALVKQMGAKNAKQALELSKKMGYATVKEAAPHFARLGVATADEGIKLLSRLGTTMPAAITAADKLGATTIKQFADYLSKLSANSADEALTMLRKLGTPSASEAVDLMARTGAKNAKEALEIMQALEVKTLKDAAATGEKKIKQIAQLAERIGLSDAARAALLRVMRDLGEAEGEKFISQISKLGKETIENASVILKHLPPSAAQFIFTNSTLGVKFFAGLGKMKGMFAKMGIDFIKVAPKLAKGIAKIIPAAGALISGYDAVRLGKIAIGGSWGGKEYRDPDVRALALFGAGMNTVDTALGIAEAFGVGNIGILANIGLAAAEIAVDVAVDYYNDNPGSMPQSMRTAIRTGSAVLAVSSPLAFPGVGFGVTAALAYIYKDELGPIIENLYKKGKAGLQVINQWARENVRAAVNAIDRKIDEIMTGAGNAFAKLHQLYQQGDAFARQVMNKLVAKLSTAWQNSSYSNGYQGFRDLVSEMYQQASAAGAAGIALLRAAITKLDNEHLGGYMPDFLYNWI